MHFCPQCLPDYCERAQPDEHSQVGHTMAGCAKCWVMAGATSTMIYLHVPQKRQEKQIAKAFA